MSMGNGLTTELKTIMFADVVGYTRLTETNEANTHRALRNSLHIVSELIDKHQGVVAHYAGDAVLAQFSSVINGINCAVAIQNSITERNKSLTDLPQILFRIGINVGDVILDEGEIYGEAVNTAVRLQSVSDPGGVCISEAVRNAIGNRLLFAYEFIGDERLKNLTIPVRAYRVLMETSEKVHSEADYGGKPSVAIMPFENSGELSHERTVDSFTEDVIRELSRFHGLDVIAHHSTFIYKDRRTKVQQVAEEMGVEFVVEGNVRIADERLRANVQLIDALSGHHIWSELYNQRIDDTYTAQDEVIREIVAAIAGRLHIASSNAALRRPTEELHAFDHVLRGQALVGKGAESNKLARVHYQRALALNSDFARALTGNALSHVDDWWNGWAEDPDKTLSLAFEAAMSAYSNDISDSKVHWVLGLIHLLRGEIEQASRLVNRAIEINPNDADSYAVQALVSIYQRDTGCSQRAISTALMLNPYPSAWYRWVQGVSFFINERTSDALYVLLEAVQQNPELNVARAYLIAVYMELHENDAACSEANRLLAKNPGLTANALVDRLPVMTESGRDRLISAFIQANIPE